MKFIFIVQGEGRGHFTQAISLRKILEDNGHQVIKVLVGTNSNRNVPSFFRKQMNSPIKTFLSPSFHPTSANQRANISRSLFYNIKSLSAFYSSIRFLKTEINTSDADLVINFYELLTGISYAINPPSIPYICIAHQYFYLHKEFVFPKCNKSSLLLLKLFTKMTSIRATERLALSFAQKKADMSRKITVVPPLLRDEIKKLSPYNDNYIHGYMVNAGYIKQVKEYSKKHRAIKMHFFSDKEAATNNITDSLVFHKIDDLKFLKYMEGCSAYASTAGFESICEAMYLGKPVMLVPVHIEQDCNAFDAMNHGAGIISKSFDINKLVEFKKNYSPNVEFTYWVNSSERFFLDKIENVVYKNFHGYQFI